MIMICIVQDLNGCRVKTGYFFYLHVLRCFSINLVVIVLSYPRRTPKLCYNSDTNKKLLFLTDGVLQFTLCNITTECLELRLVHVLHDI